MQAVVWHGDEDIRVESVDDPRIEQETDVIIEVTATAICGSDLHLYGRKVMGMREGDILGHEPMGRVVEAGSAVADVRTGDVVVVPFNIACGYCFMCARGLQSQCETTQNHDTMKGADLFGYTHLYGGVPGGQAEYLRVPQGHYGPIPVPPGAAEDRWLLLSDVLPTAWQAVMHADVPPGSAVAVVGLGPIGQMAARMALHRGAAKVIGIDRVPERLEMARRHGVEVLDLDAVRDPIDAVRQLTMGRGADAVIEAVGMEAEGTRMRARIEEALQMVKVKPDRHAALRLALKMVRRGGTVSVVGVYVGPHPMFPLGELFDRQVTIRMGQANVRRWTDELIPLVADGDPLGLDDLITHRLPLRAAPEAYEMFREKRDGAVKVVLHP
jgi:threonine dehydrogenase-like Zn-dependent dehydrogenase